MLFNLTFAHVALQGLNPYPQHRHVGRTESDVFDDLALFIPNKNFVLTCFD